MPLDGECIKDTFYLIASNPVPVAPVLELPGPTLKTCCGACSYKVLADMIDPFEYNNDRNGFLFWFQDVVSSATLTLTRFDHTTGTYQDVKVLNDTSLGTLYDYGFFTNDKNEHFIGYQLEWRLVLLGYGEGSYKVRCDFTSIIGNGFTLSDEYCLSKYSPAAADNSVRIEYWLRGILGMNADDPNYRDYGDILPPDGWYNQVRLKGVFSFTESKYEKDYTLYNSGARQWTKDEQEPEWNLLLKPMCWNFHELMRTDVLQADQILITDYNSNNFARWIKKDVQPVSGYKPNFFLKQSLLASVTSLTFRQRYNNLKKRRC